MELVDYLKYKKSDDALYFYTKSDMLICKGYDRFVVGKRGPYVEFNDEQVVKANIYIPLNKKYKIISKTAYYVEYRTIDISYTKIYHQLKTVRYADYLVGKWYISPYDLKVFIELPNEMLDISGCSV